MLTVQEVLALTEGTLLQGDHEQKIGHVHFDSRLLEKDALFVALTTGNRDGHSFLHSAQENGAVAALVSKEDLPLEQLKDLALILVQDTERAFQKLAAAYRQRLEIPIIAITGSNGKTSTKDMVAHILSAKFQVYKTHKNLNNHLGVPLSLLQIQDSHEAAVLELGMNHAGEIDLLAQIAKPSISIITNVGDAHIEFLGSRENIAKAKGELLPHTDPNQYVLLNKDDELVSSIAYLYPGTPKFYSTKEQADVYATDIQYNENGTSFVLHLDGQQTKCYMPMLGEHNVANVLPGAYIAYQLGMSLEQISAALLTLKISDMRFELLYGPNESIMINDAYNASATSMKTAIHTFEHIYPTRKKVVVLADMLELGEHAESLHREVGVFLKGKNMTVLTTGNDARWISEEADGVHFSSREELITQLQAYLSSEYILFFKASRGMKLENIIQALIPKKAE